MTMGESAKLLNKAGSVWLIIYNRKLLSKYEMKSPVFWGIMPCCPLKVNHHFQRNMLPSLPESKHPCKAFRSNKIELYPYLILSYSMIFMNKYFCVLWKERLVWYTKETFVFYISNSLSRIPIEKLILAQLLWKFHALYETWRFIIMVDLRFSHSGDYED
jgi:hypothetical protein